MKKKKYIIFIRCVNYIGYFFYSIMKARSAFFIYVFNLGGNNKSDYNSEPFF